MPLIQWNSDFEIGIDDIDREHRELISDINLLHDEISAGAGPREALGALGDIYKKIADHFAHEEQIMRDTKYMAYAEHKEDHEILLDDLRDIMGQVEDDGSYARRRLARDLEYWFTEHFRTHDSRLHRHGKKDG